MPKSDVQVKVSVNTIRAGFQALLDERNAAIETTLTQETELVEKDNVIAEKNKVIAALSAKNRELAEALRINMEENAYSRLFTTIVKLDDTRCGAVDNTTKSVRVKTIETLLRKLFAKYKGDPEIIATYLKMRLESDIRSIIATLEELCGSQ